MKFLTSFSLKNPAAIIIMTVIIFIAGIFASTQLKRETMPDIAIPVVAVITAFPGASSNEIMDTVTKPIEQALKGVGGMDSVTSTTSDNSSVVIAQFSFSKDMDEAKKQVDELVSSVSLPEDALKPNISRITFDSMPVVQLSVSNDKVKSEQLQKTIKDIVIPEFEGTDGVAQVQLLGETKTTVGITLDESKMKKEGLTPQDIKTQLDANNLGFPVGVTKIKSIEHPINVSGQLQSLDDLRQLQIPIYPDPNEQMKQAFEDIGEGIGEIGKAVGGLAQGMSGITLGLNGQNQLLSAIHDTESQILAAELQMKDLKAVIQNPSISEEEKVVAEASLAEMDKQVSLGRIALNEMKGQLTSIQKQMESAAKMPPPAPKPKETKKVDPEVRMVSLENIAKVKLVQEKSSSISRVNGTNSMVLNITKSQDANTVDVSKDIQKQVEVMKSSLPEGTTVDVLYDQADMVNESIDAMVKEGLLGALFACIIILFFLRNVRSTLISVISIPLSILIALFAMKQLDISLNILTLGALAIAVGRVVDDSIVVIENIYRHIQESTERTASLIRNATMEVLGAITSSTITTAAVFLPLAFVEGMIGVMFKPFAFAVVISLLASLLVAVTVVPMLAKFLLLRGKIKPVKEEIGRLERIYGRVLKWSLHHKIWTLVIALMMFVGSLILIPFVGSTFMPAADEKFVTIDIETAAGTEINETDKLVKDIEKVIMKSKDHELIQTTVGSGDILMGQTGGSNKASMFIQLEDNANVTAIMKKWNNSLKPFQSKDVLISVEEMNPNSGASSQTIVDLTVTGAELTDIKKGADEVEAMLKNIKGLGPITNNLEESKPEIAINVHQDVAAKAGLSTAQIGAVVKERLGETALGKISIKDSAYDLHYRLDADPMKNLDLLKSLILETPMDKKVKLIDLADVEVVDGPVSITSKDGRQYASISVPVKDKNAGKVMSEVAVKLDALSLPSGVDASMGGTVDQMNDSFAQIGFAIVIAIGIVYLVMVITFGEAKAPFAILFSLPLAVIGGILGLFLAGVPLDMPSMIGFLMLIGIVVTNAIVYVDRVQEKRKAGNTIRDSLMEAGVVRLRPILMTALATMGALSPLAVGWHGSVILSQSLAIVVIGGLATSTVLTLVVVPVIYEILYRRQRKKESLS